jgi:hypothetical protein
MRATVTWIETVLPDSKSSMGRFGMWRSKRLAWLICGIPQTRLHGMISHHVESPLTIDIQKDLDIWNLDSMSSWF